MGKMLVNVVDQHVECELVAYLIGFIGKDAGLISGINENNIFISDNPKELLKGEVIDFTTPDQQ